MLWKSLLRTVDQPLIHKYTKECLTSGLLYPISMSTTKSRRYPLVITHNCCYICRQQLQKGAARWLLLDFPIVGNLGGKAFPVGAHSVFNAGDFCHLFKLCCKLNWKERRVSINELTICSHSINTQAFFTHNIILAMFGGTFGIVLCDSVHAGVSKTVLKLRCI